MRLTTWHNLTLAAAFVVATAYSSTALAVTASVSYQNGIDGYSGTFDRKIDERGGTQEHDGAAATRYFLDGYDGQGSPDGQALVRFDNIIGNGPGQIPAGATILSADFQVTTATTGSSNSVGPWGVAQLLNPFDSSTTYFGSYNCGGCALVSRGAWFEDGYTERPLAGFGSNWHGEVSSADVRTMVQNWTNGATNHGIVIQTGNPAGTADGWGVESTGHPLVERRPKLSVTYTTETVEANTFQRGLNGYTGDVMAYVKSGDNIVGTATEPDSARDDITYNGLTGDFTVASNTVIESPTPLGDFQEFLDGPQFATPEGESESVDDFALIKFNDVFGAAANQAPSDVPVAKAWVSITTGTDSAAAPSIGQYSIHRVLNPWDTTSLHSSFGSIPGLQASDGDVSAPLDIQEGIIYGSEVWFDVTSYLEGIRTGATDNGLAIQANNTADGWQIHLNGSTDPEFRPKLHVLSAMLPIVNPTLAGDFNGDGSVDAADYTTWRDNLGGTHNLNGNGDETGGSAGIVDQADYSLWKSNFGQTSSGIGGAAGSAVPEPTSLGLLLVAVVGLIGAGRCK